MRLVVDEEQVGALALPTFMAGDSLAPGLAWELLTAIAAGMPGSQSARFAASLAHLLAAETGGLRAELVVQSELLTAASRSYTSSELMVRSSSHELGATFGDQK